MSKPEDLDPKTRDYIGALAKVAKKCNAGVTMSSFKNCEAWGGVDVFIVVKDKGADNFDVVKSIMDSLEEE